MNKEKSKQYYFLRSLMYLKPYKGWLSLCILSCILASGLSVMFPIFTEKTITAFTNHDGRSLLISASLLLLFQIASSVTHMLLWGTNADKLRARLTKDIRYNAIGSILNLKTKNFDLHGSGKLLQVVSSDTASLSGIYTSIVDVFMSLLSKLAVFVYIFVANYILGFYCVLEFVVVCFAYHIRIKARMIDQRKLRKECDKNIGLVNETIRGVRDVKNYNIQSPVMDKVDESLTAIERCDHKYGSKQYQLFRMTVITKNVMTFLFIPLALLLIHFNLTTYATAFTIFVFRTDITSVIDWFMNTWEYAKDGGVYAERIFNVIDGFKEGFEDFPEQDGFKKLPKKLSIEINDVSFSYNNSNKLVLEGLNLTVPYGSKIAIVGESGCGKSTILKLLNRNYDIENGEILIGGQNVRKFSKKTLRDIITIVPQDPYIFNFSILDNLRIINPHASKSQVEKACKKAQIHDFIMAQPAGYDTILGEAGTRLSGGQKQRLAIARAFLKDSPILIFDETTSALDNENQSKIKDAINGVGRNKIVIIVAHRLSTIVDADTIHFIKNGKVEISGTHSQLLAGCKEYQRLYQHEATKQEEVESVDID